MKIEEERNAKYRPVQNRHLYTTGSSQLEDLALMDTAIIWRARLGHMLDRKPDFRANHLIIGQQLCRLKRSV